MKTTIKTAGVALAMLGLTSGCVSSADSYGPPPPASNYASAPPSSYGPQRDMYQPPATLDPAQPYATPWPLRVDSASGQIAVFQPQPETFEGDKLTARSAVSLTPPGATEPVFGAMWMQARVATDRDTRTVRILDIQVKQVKFPDAEAAQQQQFAQVIEQEIPRMNVSFSLDELLASLQVVEKEQTAAAQLQTAPPKIIFTSTRSTLVVVDGEPKLQPVEQTRVMRVVNTPFVLLFDMDGRRYFLKAGETWFVAPEVKGPWASAAGVPAAVTDIAARLVPPPTQPAPGNPVPPPAPQFAPRQVIVVTEPTELISTDGAPAYSALPGNELLFITNTQSDVFMEVGTQTHYVLLSGRWYRTRSLQQGPWEFVPSDQLPQAFASIPANSPKAHVLASVAGTIESRDARYDAQIPQTAAIRRTGGEPLNVNYDGAPRFESIQESPVQYAVNTPESVLLVDGRYYCCHQAVWYESPVASGPWAVCVAVPRPIYLIPPSCPVYHVRYVYVYDYTPDVVYCGYTSGYVGSYVYGPTVVYGTGFYYSGWYGTTYYARPWTWGCGALYDPYVGAWGFGAPYGWDRRWVVRDDDRHEHGWFGPRGFVGYHGDDRGDRGFASRETHVNVNIYNRTENVTRNVTVNRNVVANRGGAGGRSEPARNGGGYTPPTAGNPSTYRNNIYAGHDGQVYRRTDDGWEQRGRQGWQKLNSIPEAVPVQRPAANPGAGGRSGAAGADERRGDAGARGRGGEAAGQGRGGEAAGQGRGGAVQDRGAGSPNRPAPGTPGGRVEVPEESRRGPNDAPVVRQAPQRAAPGLEADHSARQRFEPRAPANRGDSGSRGDSGGRSSGGSGGGNRDSGGGGNRDSSGGGNRGGGSGGGGGGGGGGNGRGK